MANLQRMVMSLFFLFYLIVLLALLIVIRRSHLSFIRERLGSGQLSFQALFLGTVNREVPETRLKEGGKLDVRKKRVAIAIVTDITNMYFCHFTCLSVDRIE